MSDNLMNDNVLTHLAYIQSLVQPIVANKDGLCCLKDD